MQNRPFNQGFGDLAPPEHPLRGVAPSVITRATFNDPAVSAAIQQAANDRFLRDVSHYQQQQSAQGNAVKLQVWELDNKGAAFNCTAAMRRVGMTDELLAVYNAEIHGAYMEYEKSAAFIGAEIACCVLTLGWSVLCVTCWYDECHRYPSQRAAVGAAVGLINTRLNQNDIPLTFRFEPIGRTARVTLQ